MDVNCAASLVGKAAAVPYAPMVAFEAYQAVVGVTADIQRGTTRNTSENIWGAAGAATGALTGGAALSYIGNAIFPGVGSVIGATVGATIGGLEGDHYARERAGVVFDRWEYNIKVFRCKKCNKRYKCRIYTSQSRKYCVLCAEEEDK